MLFAQLNFQPTTNHELTIVIRQRKSEDYCAIDVMWVLDYLATAQNY